MSRCFALASSVAAITVAGCVHAAEDTSTSSSARLAVSREGRVATSWSVGNVLHGMPRSAPLRLAAEVNSTLIAALAPGAVPDPAGRLVVYNSWRGRSPVLRVYDLGRGSDRVLAVGALSAAWRRDGALAYFAALRPRVRTPRTYVGHLVIRRRLGQPAERWTQRPARYVAAAWAGERLLAYRVGGGWPDLLALDGAGSVRVLARDSALVAVSPDGRSAFVAAYGRRPALVRVLSVSDGSEVARLEPRNVEWVVEAGSWVGDRVFASSSGGLAIFRVKDDRVELEDVLRAPAAFPIGLAEPQADEDGRRVVAHGELASQPRQAIPAAAVVECDLKTRRCAMGPQVASIPGPRLVYNPSRPLP